MRPWTDRSLWFVLVVVVAGAISVQALADSWDATAASLLAGLFAIAMLYDAIERQATRPAATIEIDAAPGQPRGAELEALLQAIPNPLLIVRNGRVEHCNQPALELFGYHIPGADVRLAVRHPAAVDRLLGPAAQAGARSRTEIVGIGSPEQSWELQVEQLAGDRIIALFIDQSGRQATERMRVDFVANASHELRTPLAGILGFIETLRDPEAGADPATRERFLTIMDGEARRMQRLVDDLMSLSRIEADKYRAPGQPVALDVLADEVTAVFRNSANPRANDIVVATAQNVPVVRGDRAQLSQLLHNLVSNALKYGTPGTEVRVATRRLSGDMVELSVTDHGEGISAEHLPRLTERFYRVDSSRSRAMGGTGLGLAIVKHIVQRHRGLLHVDSILGKGTSVRVELPIFAAGGDGHGPGTTADDANDENMTEPMSHK